MPARTPLRPKHVPHRTCVACGTIGPKRTLVRVVRTPQGQVIPDPTGKMPGRGAYLCTNPQCWDQAVKKGRLERSLKAKLTAQEVDSLRSWAQELGLGTVEEG